MDWDIRIGDEIRTDSASHGISDTGVITSFDRPHDDDGELYACFADYKNLDTGVRMPMYILFDHITHNLSADARDNYFHESIKAMVAL